MKVMAKKNVKSPDIEFEEEFEKIAGHDNPPIDITFIQMIKDGRIRLTDALFFEHIKESSAYLSQKPFQDKVSHWIQAGDRKKLNRIQTALKTERRGRKASKTGGFKSFEIKKVFIENVKLINEFLDKHVGVFNSEKNKLFKESYPASNINFCSHKTARQLAYDLTSQELNISERTLRNITKYVHFINASQEKFKKQ